MLEQGDLVKNEEESNPPRRENLTLHPMWSAQSKRPYWSICNWWGSL